MRLHTGVHGHRKRVRTESRLWEENPLPHLGWNLCQRHDGLMLYQLSYIYLANLVIVMLPGKMPQYSVYLFMNHGMYGERVDECGWEVSARNVLHHVQCKKKKKKIVLLF